MKLTFEMDYTFVIREKIILCDLEQIKADFFKLSSNLISQIHTKPLTWEKNGQVGRFWDSINSCFIK